MPTYLKTSSETLFEQFLADHELPFETVPVADCPRPDYAVGGGIHWGPIVFEVKELTEDEAFGRGESRVITREVGKHIRRKIGESKKQIQYGAKQVFHRLADLQRHRPGVPYVRHRGSRLCSRYAW